MKSSISGNTEHALPKASMASFEEINRALDDLQPLAPRINELKKEILEKEVEVLKAILEKVTPLIPLLSKDYEACYLHDLTILENTQMVNFEGDAAFYSEHMLILYENGRLIDQHRYGETITSSRIGWEIIDEIELSAMAAISAYGLEAIAVGLTKVIKAASQIAVLKDELELNLDTLINTLGYPPMRSPSAKEAA
ncbi:MAG: hypothetical protein WB392_13610 [Methanotrichaceae archaeon]